MILKKLSPVIALLIFICHTTACIPGPDPSIYYVATTGNDSNDCHTPATACLTVGAAVDKASDGNTIFIMDGNYIEIDSVIPTVGVVVDKDLIFEGLGDARIDGDAARTVLSISPGVSTLIRNLTIHNGNAEVVGGIMIGNGASLELIDSTVRNNVAVAGTLGPGLYNAGGIYNQGELILNNVEILFNYAHHPPGSEAYGGGVFNQGTLTMTESLVAMNTAEDLGSGLYNAEGASATLTSSMVDDNLQAGGIWNSGDLILVDSTVRANTVFDPTAFICGGVSNTGSFDMSGGVVADNGSPGFFGGICNFEPDSTALVEDVQVIENIGGGIVNYGVMTIQSTEVGDNTSGGVWNYLDLTIRLSKVHGHLTPKGAGIWNVSGDLDIHDTTIANNEASMWGGGLMNNQDATTLIEGSTITDNHAVTRGGGIFNEGDLHLLNTTVSGNSAPEGAGIGNNGEMRLSSTTITGNRQHGISSVNIGVTRMRNTIIAGNVVADCFGTDFITLGHNLDGDGTCDLKSASNDLIAVPALLGPLTDNGGPTHTHALLPASPAIDSGVGAADCPAVDQRNTARPQGVACDIGAFELEGELIPIAPPATEILQPMATSTPTPEEAQPPTATALMNANCRFGPDKIYRIIGALLEGETSQIDGRNQDDTWLWILNPNAQGHCWVSTSTVDVSGDLTLVPIVAAPPTPTPEPRGCYVYGQTSDELICVVPCPENAKPGGECTP